MWGPEEALILTVIEMLAPKTTPEDVYREDGTQNLAERKKQNSTQDFENEKGYDIGGGLRSKERKKQDSTRFSKRTRIR